MPYTAIEQTLSVNRFSTYRQAVITSLGQNCTLTTLKLYEWNAELSSRFFFPIHIYEVAIRNAISDAISGRYGSDWPTNTVFQNSLNHSDKQTLLTALRNGYQGVGKLLPEIKFVWFENMLTSRHDGRIWKPYITKTFPNAPTSMTPQEIRKALKDACYIIRKFRNRCGHHEPIFNSASLYDVYPHIRESLNWRCATTSNWMNSKQSVSELLCKPVI
ncbi:Abi family protein [Marinomonas sp. A79]|uniref:Abi family protein n=1 Tax=Marinomonas vulgaris TaxID=2823372 RepID=A0ABS5HCM5_9GAMM|nr:Abi family protein [Marinomonas vulgaris]MBR7889406.1 Abi family protein [Marinomonas vulgaris]